MTSPTAPRERPRSLQKATPAGKSSRGGPAIAVGIERRDDARTSSIGADVHVGAVATDTEVPAEYGPPRGEQRDRDGRDGARCRDFRLCGRPVEGRTEGRARLTCKQKGTGSQSSKESHGRALYSAPPLAGGMDDGTAKRATVCVKVRTRGPSCPTAARRAHPAASRDRRR